MNPLALKEMASHERWDLWEVDPDFLENSKQGMGQDSGMDEDEEED